MSEPNRNDPSEHPKDHLDRRLASLEEAVMFHEQAARDAREVAEEAVRRMLVLERRLSALEERLGSLVTGDPDLPEHERPPHSAG